MRNNRCTIFAGMFAAVAGCASLAMAYQKDAGVIALFALGGMIYFALVATGKD
jgi:hypothetical protein